MKVKLKKNNLLKLKNTSTTKVGIEWDISIWPYAKQYRHIL